jgi:hypothetical protein
MNVRFYEISEAFRDDDHVVKLVKSVYFDYMATRTGGFAEYVFDLFAFEVPLGLEDDGEIIEVAKKVVLDGLATSGKKGVPQRSGAVRLG